MSKFIKRTEETTTRQDFYKVAKQLPPKQYKFVEEAQFGAKLFIALATRRELNPGDFSVVDIGCGGQIGKKMYPPFFLTQLAIAGIPRNNLIGIDVAEPLENLEKYYHHNRLDITAAVDEVLGSIDKDKTSLGRIITEARENSKKGKLFITMNNLFGNTDSTLLRDYNGGNEERFFSAITQLLQEGDYLIMFDGIQAERNMLYVFHNGELVVSRNSQVFESKYKERFPYVAS